MSLVWYVTYGSNMARTRFNCYVSGGQPPGGVRTYPGCRDQTPPHDDRPVFLDGGMYFAMQSPTWGGGLALYDPDLDGQAPARAYLITVGQFSDIAAQEMHRTPDTDLDLTEVLANGRAQTGPGRYETLLNPGSLDDSPLLTFTAPWQATDVELNAPAAAYLRMIGQGLQETHQWSAQEVSNYLATRPGASLSWSTAKVSELLAASHKQHPPAWEIRDTPSMAGPHVVPAGGTLESGRDTREGQE